jgi:tetratricopeptide (TPR) repeat protein
MNKLDIIHKLDGELERRKSALLQQATVERANNLRKLLKARAGIYETLNDFDRAEVEYNNLVDVKPSDPMVYVDRGYFYMRQSRFDAAMRDFIAGSRMAPTQSAFSYGVGRALARMGNYSAAISQYKEAIRLAPSDSAPVLSRAEAYTQIGMYTQARDDFDRVIALGLPRDTDRFSVYFGRGYANIRLGDDNAAVRDFNAALSVQPRMVNALVWRGYARERLGQRQRALADYELALQVSPDDNWIRSSIRRART